MLSGILFVYDQWINNSDQLVWRQRRILCLYTVELWALCIQVIIDWGEQIRINNRESALTSVREPNA